MQNSMWLHLGLSKTPRVSKAQNVLKNKKHLKREREREKCLGVSWCDKLRVI